MSNSIDATAIGCEKLCGRCAACEPIVWANVIASQKTFNRMRQPDDPPEVIAVHDAAAALDVPSALAGLLARAIRGRGVRLIRCSQQMVEPYTTIVVILRESCRTLTLTMAQARTALARVMALPLDCGANAAIAALEVT